MRKLLMLGVMAVAVPGSAHAAAFMNGSFETGPTPGAFTTLTAPSSDINGWTVTSGSIDYIGSLWTASDGGRSLDMAGASAGAIAQTFDTLSGRSYRVTFDLAGNPQGGDRFKQLSIFATGVRNVAQTEAFDRTGRTEAAMGWSPRSYTFLASDASTTLSFTSLSAGAYGPALDNVTVTQLAAVPELQTWAMMVGGFGVIGGALRRKRRSFAALA